MRTIFCLAALFLLPSIAMAQNKYYDVVSLKNGSVIKGIITQRIPDESVTILIGGRQSVTFYLDEIDYIKKEGRISLKDNSTNRRGYFSRNEMGVSFRKNRDWQGSYVSLLPSFQTVHGYKWNQYLEVGLGVGTDFYETVATVPVFLHVSGLLTNTRVAPFYLIQYGDSFVINGDQIRIRNTDVKAKEFFKIGGGLEIRTAVNSIYVSFAFKKNKVEFIDSWTDFSRKDTRIYRSFNVGVGMKF